MSEERFLSQKTEEREKLDHHPKTIRRVDRRTTQKELSKSTQAERKETPPQEKAGDAIS